MQEMKVYKLYLEDRNGGCITEVVPAFSQAEAEANQAIPTDCELVTTKEVADYCLDTDKVAEALLKGGFKLDDVDVVTRDLFTIGLAR